MRETSSRSSSSSDMCCTCRSITLLDQRFCASLAFSLRAMVAAWRIGASGLRSSCASVARNSSLRRSASSSSRSCSLRFVMSANHTARSPSSGDATTWYQLLLLSASVWRSICRTSLLFERVHVHVETRAIVPGPRQNVGHLAARELAGLRAHDARGGGVQEHEAEVDDLSSVVPHGRKNDEGHAGGFAAPTRTGGRAGSPDLRRARAR